jgi:hypothetical protein
MQKLIEKQPRTISVLTGNHDIYDLIFVKDPLGHRSGYWIIVKHAAAKNGSGSTGNSLIFYAVEIYIIGNEKINYTDMSGKEQSICDVRSVSSFEALTEYGIYGYYLTVSGWTIERISIAASVKAPADKEFLKSPNEFAKRMQPQDKRVAGGLCLTRNGVMLYDNEKDEGKTSYPIEIEAII